MPILALFPISSSLRKPLLLPISLLVIAYRILNATNMRHSKNGLQPQIDLESQRCHNVDADARCKRALTEIVVYFPSYGVNYKGQNCYNNFVMRFRNEKLEYQHD